MEETPWVKQTVLTKIQPIIEKKIEYQVQPVHSGFYAYNYLIKKLHE